MIAKKKIIATTLCGMIAVAAPLALSGCGGGNDSNQPAAYSVSQTDYQIELGAVNSMANNALKCTFTNIERRPMSVFAGSKISSNSSEGMDGTADSEVKNAATTDIVIQVDVSFTWNLSTYSTAASGTSMPKTLGDLFSPGTLMYVTGVDSDGNTYTSSDIISPEEQSDINALAINSQWDYDVLNSPLPETSVTKTGSFLIRVPSTVDDLRLVIITPMAGQDPSQPDKIKNGRADTYELVLS